MPRSRKKCASSSLTATNGYRPAYQSWKRRSPCKPRQANWVTAGVWGALALLASFIVPRILERVFQ